MNSLNKPIVTTDQKYICPISFGRDDFHLAQSLLQSNKLYGIVIERPKFLHKTRIAVEMYYGQNYILDKRALLLDSIRRIRLFFGNDHLANRLINWFYVSQSVGAVANTISRKNKNVNVFSELYSANTAFKHLNPNKCVLFQTHPYCTHLKNLYNMILSSESRLGPEILTQSTLHHELEMQEKEIFDALRTPALRASKIICASSYVKKSITESQPELSNIIHVSPYGVDSKKYPRKEKKICKKFIFLYVGQNTARKGFNNLIQAWGSGIKNCELHMVGFEAKQNSLEGLPESIVLHGKVNHSELIRLMHLSNCFIFPSLSEGFGLVLLQAISTGLPIIATHNSAAPDILNLFDVGSLINPFDPLDIKDKMMTVADNMELAAKWSHNTTAATQYFTWERFHRNINLILNYPRF